MNRLPTRTSLTFLTDEEVAKNQSDFKKANPNHFINKPQAKISNISPSVKLRISPHEWKQGQHPYCTGYAMAMAMEITNNEQHPRKNHFYDPVFVYVQESRFYGRQNLASAAEVARQYGMVSPTKPYHWRYTTNANFNSGISNWAGIYATSFLDIKYIKTQLEFHRTAVPFGFDRMYDNMCYFYKHKNENYMPGPRGKRPKEGHAMCIFGYSDARQAFAVKNSWGNNWSKTKWGKGTVWVPYDLFLNQKARAYYIILTDRPG